MSHDLPTRRAAITGLALLPLAVASPAVATNGPETRSFHDISKAMWVWKYSPGQAARVQTFATQHNIATLFVSIPAAARLQLLNGDSMMAAELRVLSQHGRAVYALAGDPSWVETPNEIQPPLQLLIDIQDKLHVFHGLHLDVEPHSLPAWRSGAEAQGRLSANYLAFLATVRAHTKSWTLDVAVHPMLARLSLPDGRNALRAVTEQVTSVSLMAYRDNADTTIQWATPAIDILQAAHRRWRMGVLMYASKEPRTSFIDQPPDQFYAETAKLDALLRAHDQGGLYNGLVFEDYDALRIKLSSTRHK